MPLLQGSHLPAALADSSHWALPCHPVHVCSPHAGCAGARHARSAQQAGGGRAAAREAIPVALLWCGRSQRVVHMQAKAGEVLVPLGLDACTCCSALMRRRPCRVHAASVASLNPTLVLLLSARHPCSLLCSWTAFWRTCCARALCERLCCLTLVPKLRPAIHSTAGRLSGEHAAVAHFAACHGRAAH